MKEEKLERKEWVIKIAVSTVMSGKVWKKNLCESAGGGEKHCYRKNYVGKDLFGNT